MTKSEEIMKLVRVFAKVEKILSHDSSVNHAPHIQKIYDEANQTKKETEVQLQAFADDYEKFENEAKKPYYKRIHEAMSAGKSKGIYKDDNGLV